VHSPHSWHCIPTCQVVVQRRQDIGLHHRPKGGVLICRASLQAHDAQAAWEAETDCDGAGEAQVRSRNVETPSLESHLCRQGARACQNSVLM
jgi:hypothetical protein